MKKEKAVQYTYYLLIITIFISLLSYNDRLLISYNFRILLISSIAVLLVIQLALYFKPKKVKNKNIAT
jgi:hypothetical protein